MGNQSARVPAPRSPQIAAVTSVEELLPMARLIVNRKQHGNMAEGLELRRGEKVLVITDSTLDPLVLEALTLVIRECGGKVDVISLQGYPNLTEPVDLVDEMFSKNWFPGWVWQAIPQADVLLHGAFLKLAHTPDLPMGKGGQGPRTVPMEWDRELFLSNYNTFPVEVRDAVDQKTWELLAGAKKIEIIDPEGTELSITLSPEDWQREDKRQRQRFGLPYMPGHLLLPLPTTTANGTLATSSLTFGGPVPRVKLTIEEGRITRVEDGGRLGERLNQSFAEFNHVLSPRTPGPGVNWITNMAICTNPKAIRSSSYAKMSGSGRMHAWAFGHRRSGVIHFSHGDGVVSPGYKVIRHMDLYFPTLLADGKKVIEAGHLLALDAPEVKQRAEKYEDAESLLTEDWIPEVC